MNVRGARMLARWVPESWHRARLDPGRRGALVLVAVVAAAALVAAVGVWRDRPVAEPAPPLASAVASPDLTRPGEPGVHTPGQRAAGGVPLVVSVAGKVRRPGLVRMSDGARVADAIAAAGGPLPRVDLTALNLARRVADGEQIVVGLPLPPGGVPDTSGAAGPGPAAVPGGKVDLNRAALEQLDTLPGVGPVTAQRILDWRAKHGRFTAVEQLREVEGIGERRFTQLRELVTV
ncbi:MAG: ComEA family DNA-binding protein [Pseudonocardia sp.]